MKGNVRKIGQKFTSYAMIARLGGWVGNQRAKPIAKPLGLETFPSCCLKLSLEASHGLAFRQIQPSDAWMAVTISSAVSSHAMRLEKISQSDNVAHNARRCFVDVSVRRKDGLRPPACRRMTVVEPVV